jgi:cyclohexyl-isocyanide hydratase
MAQPISVVIPVYDGVTQLDFTGPHQFLSRTPDLHVRVASLDGEAVVGPPYLLKPGRPDGHQIM